MTPPYDAAATMASRAARVRSAGASSLPALWALTDPQRTPDPLALARRLPAGSGLIYRHFGAADRERVAQALADICRARGLVFLIGNDADLAARSGADGVHWPERSLAEAAARRARGDVSLFTSAAHSGRALHRAAQAGIDACLLSPVFPSASPSAGRPLGLFPAARLAQGAALPVFALGGLNPRTAKRLEKLGFSGIACVGAL